MIGSLRGNLGILNEKTLIEKVLEEIHVTSLDDFFEKTQSIGSEAKALSNNLYGLNHQGIRGMVQENRDSSGLAFFTRPQLNLQSANVANIRHMYSLLSNNPNSIQTYVRNMLDPRLATNPKHSTRSTLVDNSLGFIPVLTNNITSMSGWPDIVTPTFSSKSGIRKEQYSQVDGSTDILDSFDIDCTFKNMKDEPIILLMETWTKYMSNVFEGTMSPYLDFITENEIDYNTRIYRLILDETNRYVKKIAATGASFPINVPTGKIFDYNVGTKYSDQNKEINIRFKTVGAMYNDDILIQEFNQVSAIFNSDMRKLVARDPSHSLEKIPYKLLSLFNHRGYPYINAETMELEWYISRNSTTYKNIIKALS